MKKLFITIFIALFTSPYWLNAMQPEKRNKYASKDSMEIETYQPKALSDIWEPLSKEDLMVKYIKNKEITK
jgi:hypothetical protein